MTNPIFQNEGTFNAIIEIADNNRRQTQNKKQTKASRERLTTQQRRRASRYGVSCEEIKY